MLLELFKIMFGLFFWQTVILLVVMFLLRKYAWSTILQVIEKQEEAYLQADKQAKEVRKITSKLQEQSEQILKRANTRRECILKNAIATKKAILEEAKIEAIQAKELLLTNAQKTIAKEKEASLVALKQQIALLVIQATEKLLERELSEKNKQDALLKMLIAKADTKYSTTA